MSKNFKKKSLSQHIRDGESITPKRIIEEAFIFVFATEQGVTAQHDPARFFLLLQDLCFKHSFLNTGTTKHRFSKNLVQSDPYFKNINSCSLIQDHDFLGALGEPELIIMENSGGMQIPATPVPFSDLLFIVRNNFANNYPFRAISSNEISYSFDFNNQTVYFSTNGYWDLDFIVVYKPQHICPEGTDALETPFKSFVSNDFLLTLPLLLAKEIEFTIGNNSWTSAMEEELNRLISRAINRDVTKMNFEQKSYRKPIFG